MTTEKVTTGFVKTLRHPEEVSRAALLGVCASLKPGPGKNGRSATRSLLNYALNSVSPLYPQVYLTDLRDFSLPFFDGRKYDEYVNEDLRFIYSCIERAGGLLLSIPAYWSGVSGVFKNLVDVLCGPAYDLENPATLFTGKLVGLLIVGADLESATAGAKQARAIMESTGAVIVSNPIVIGNPRATSIEETTLSRDLIELSCELVMRVHSTHKSKS